MAGRAHDMRRSDAWRMDQLRGLRLLLSHQVPAGRGGTGSRYINIYRAWMTPQSYVYISFYT